MATSRAADRSDVEPRAGVDGSIGEVAADPLDAVEPAANGLGARFGAARRRGWLTVLAGVVLVVGGFGGFGYFGGRQDDVLAHGTHAVATVTSAALYGGRFGPNKFDEHIDVEFADRGGVTRDARIYIGERDRFSVGQQVDVVYDARDPQRALLAHGTHDVGPVGAPLFFAIVLGVGLVFLGIRRVRQTRRARRVLG